MPGDSQPEPDTGPAPQPDPLATPGQRLGGAIVDGAVLQVAGLALVRADATVATALSTLVYLAYEVAMVARFGHTLGKLALGTTVVDSAGAGRPTLWQAATRAVVPLAGVVVDVALGSASVGAFWVFAVYGSLLFDERRRGLHDRAAGTVVAAVERSEAHRRAGVIAVALALALTVVTVTLAVDDAADKPTPGAHPPPPAARPTS